MIELKNNFRFFYLSLPFLLAVAILFGVVRKNEKTEQGTLTGNVKDKYALFLEGFGWNTSPDPFEVIYFTVPEVFDDVFSQYNAMQLEQGFDLVPYKGKSVEKRVYEVFAYPGREDDETIRADVFVADGKIIAADICSVRIDGFMHGVKVKNNGKNQDG